MDKPTFYGIIPANVRYAKIADRAKLIFSEITAMSNKWGYCNASNGYFAQVWECDPSVISRHISSLEAIGAIRCEYIREGKQVKERKIYPLAMGGVLHPVQEGIASSARGVLHPVQGGIAPEVKENNTRVNNTSLNNKKEYVVEPSSTPFLDQNEIEEIEQQIYASKTTEKKERKSSAKKKESTAEEMDFVFQVVQYLNEKTEQNFQPGAEKTKLLILARHHADKWNLEDFKTVIDHKKSEWFIKDNLRQYLRPSTLFAAGHAEEYLQAAKLWKKKPVATSPGIVPIFRQENYANVDKSKFKF